MKYILSAVLWLVLSITGWSQKKYLYYFDSEMISTNKKDAVINGVGLDLGDSFELKLYNRRSNKLIAVEHYTDSSLGVPNGSFLSYHDNTSLAFNGNFINGNEEGLSQRWDSAGHTIDSTIYKDGEKIIEVHTGYFENGSLDSFIVNDIITNRLEKTYYNDKGEILTEVRFNGRNGVVKRYEKGILMSTDTVNTRRETEASFPGGETAWSRYVKRQVEQNIDALVRDGKSGICWLKFIVDKEGNVKNAEAITMHGSTLAKVAVDAINNGPRWKPAIQYGRPVNAFRKQPVAFTISK